MCFDYHGKWDKLSGEHSALYDPKSNISTYFGIGSWIQADVPSHKLVMGLPLYGKTWKLQDPKVNGIGAPAIGVGPGVDGVLDYYQILDFNYKNKSTIIFDTETMSYYSYVGDAWIGSDDVGFGLHGLGSWVDISFGPLARIRIGPSQDKVNLF